MKWRKLAVACGLALIAVIVYRRRDRRETVDVTHGRPSGGDESIEHETRDLETVEGIGSAYAERLTDAGVTDTAKLVDADPEALAAETDIAAGRIRSWIERAGNGAAG